MAFAKFKVKKGISETSQVGGSGYSVVPVGLILPYSNSVAPSGWLLCDGSSISSSVYPELYALIGATLPNLSSKIVIGAGTGTGGGASSPLTPPYGPISGGVALTPRTVNTSASSLDTSLQVLFSHSHSLSSHTHSQVHTHNYPHSHSFNHYHNENSSHGHGTSADGSHTHSGYFTNQYTTGPGQSMRLSGSLLAGGNFAGVNHPHNITAANAGVPATGSPQVSVATPAFAASTTTDTAPVATPLDTTAPFGTGTPTGTFSIKQPVMSVNYIIKY